MRNCRLNNEQRKSKMKRRAITETPSNPYRKGPPSTTARHRRDGEGVGPDEPAKMLPSPGRIRIIETPPGFAPLNIREEWIGVEIPLLSSEQLAADPPSRGLRVGNENVDGYVVSINAAITALREAGKERAADFWASLPLGSYLEFNRRVCQLVP